MKHPPFLNENDLVAIVSPAGKIDAIYIEKAHKYLKTKNLRVILSPFADDSYFQFASSDDNRVSDMQIMLNNPEVKAIWCTRGGYGTMRIINKIDFSILEKFPKWLIGFSDITVFHSILSNNHFVSIHGSMCINLSNDDYSNSGMDTLWELLFGKVPVYKISPHPLNRKGSANATLIGGNLSLLTSLLGSKQDFNPKGKILFIEDTGEYLYRLDRMMQSLKNSGKLAGLSGMIVGQMSEMKDNETPFGLTPYQIVADAVSEYTFPVMYDFPAGHSKPNEPLILGSQVKIDVLDDCSQLRWVFD
ncbi:MAG: LD-carboxypeptidase [Marinilabiliaceae bacterium]|nr:LD-carboxypeptidase [Marinilabiliaceae bacterium]